MSNINPVAKYLLKTLNFLHKNLYKSNPNYRIWNRFSNKDYSNNLIYQKLMDDKPLMISRLGATELACMINFLGVNKKTEGNKYLNYVKGNIPPWWWEDSIINQMAEFSGFFPAKLDEIEKFCKLMLMDISEIDVLGSWLQGEKYFSEELSKSKKVILEDLEPFFTKSPWTSALRGQKVLVVHPFSDSIQSQYKKREFLFEENILPKFKLKTVQAVQSVANTETGFKDWFEALDYMKSQIDKTDYDICIIGCGAYGLPLAAHVKRMGKKAIHLGGVTQLLFGIKGVRWEEFVVWPYENLFNQHWIRPSENERPKNAEKVEGACYW